jgi:hypothetical protein
LRVARTVQAAVAVKVVPGAQPAVGAGRVDVGIGRAGGGEGLLQAGQGGESRVPVHIGQKQDIGPGGGDDGNGGGGLRLAVGQIAGQKAGAVAAEIGVVGGDAQAFGRGRAGERQPERA